jgi:hypothetical protein
MKSSMTQRRGKTGIILKLDFEKAYDKVHWGFLRKCLRTRGFVKDGVLELKVLHNGTVAVKINGTVGPYFQSYKEVKQGDPLSPLLFNIAADCLTRTMVKAQQNNLITSLFSDKIKIMA